MSRGGALARLRTSQRAADAAIRPYAERIDLVNFQHARTPNTQPFLRPETDLVCYSINWRKDLELIRDDINACFIVGNIGETEEQMLSTASFARSIGVDLIHVLRLRSKPYSGLSTLIEQTPGYHVDADGFVYSDGYSSQHIVGLRKRIDKQFHSLLHVAEWCSN